MYAGYNSDVVVGGGEKRRQDCLVLRIVVASSRIFFSPTVSPPLPYPFVVIDSHPIDYRSLFVRVFSHRTRLFPERFPRSRVPTGAHGGVGDLARETHRWGQRSIDPRKIADYNMHTRGRRSYLSYYFLSVFSHPQTERPPLGLRHQSFPPTTTYSMAFSIFRMILLLCLSHG